MLGVRRTMDASSEALSGVGLKGAMFFSRVLGTLAMRPGRRPFCGAATRSAILISG